MQKQRALAKKIVIKQNTDTTLNHNMQPFPRRYSHSCESLPAPPMLAPFHLMQAASSEALSESLALFCHSCSDT